MAEQPEEQQELIADNVPEKPADDVAFCIKCGREIPKEETFCPLCLEDMATAPVDPLTPVLIPAQPEGIPQRKAKSRREKKPEEQVRSLRKAVVTLSVILTVVVLVAAGMITALGLRLNKLSTNSNPGQNFSTNENLGAQTTFHVKH